MQNISGLVIVLLWIFWGVWSYDIAKQKGYNANLSAWQGTDAICFTRKHTKYTLSLYGLESIDEVS